MCLFLSVFDVFHLFCNVLLFCVIEMFRSRFLECVMRCVCLECVITSFCVWPVSLCVRNVVSVCVCLFAECFIMCV